MEPSERADVHTKRETVFCRFSSDLGRRNVAKYAGTHNSELFAHILCNLLNENIVLAYNLIYKSELIIKQLLLCNCYYCHKKSACTAGK